MEISINYLAVFVAAFISFIIGWVWFSPMVFAKAWMAGAHISAETMEAGKKKMPMMAGAGFVSQLIAAFVIAHFIQLVGATDVPGALQFSFWAWLGFIAVPMLGMVLWEMKSMTYYAIVSGYWLVAVGVMSVILFLWR